MKKICVFLIGVFILFFSTSVCVAATGDIETDLSNRLFSNLDSEITEALDDFGIDSLNSDKIFNISFESIFLYYKENLKSNFLGSLHLFTKIFAIIFLAGALSLITAEQRYRDLINILLIPAITLILVDEINLCISSALSLLRLNGNFMLAFVPVYAITIAAAGNPATALTYNTLVMGFSETASAIINYGFVDLIGCYFCISIGFSVNKNINFSRYISAVNRFISFLLGLVSSVFASLLCVKGIFSASTDSVTSKGIRFAIGSLIPVIGSSISEAYSTLLGSISILKNSVAIIGLIVITLINFPVIAEIVMFNITLNLLSFLCEILDCYDISNVLKAFAGGVKIIGLMVIFEALILIITTAIMLTVKGG